MKTKVVNLFWGIVLVGLGVVFLLNELGFITLRDLSSMVWALIFAVVAAFFLVTYLLKGGQEWGWLFPTTIFAGIAMLIGLEHTAIGEFLSAAPVLLGIALPFFVRYLSDPKANQWALIPTWAMAVISAVVVFERYVNGNLVAALILYGIALPFLYVYLKDKRKQWALIPFTAMAVIGTIPLLESVVSAGWFDVVVVLLMAVPFLVVYFWKKQNWWALIPAGVFVSIALGLLSEQLLHVPFPAELFLAGLGFTFGMLWLMRARYQTDWAKYPALVLLVIAVIVLLSQESTGIIGPAALVVVGISIVVVNFLQQGKKKNERNEEQIKG